MSPPLGKFKHSEALTLGVELELQLVSRRDFDLTRGATDLIGSVALTASTLGWLEVMTTGARSRATS